MSDSVIDESKQKIIDYFFEKKDDPVFKGLQIQAGPGTGKTYLLSYIITRYIKEGHSDNFFILSHSNSSIDSISNKIGNKNNVKIKTVASFFIENFIIPFSYIIVENEKLHDLKIEWTNYGKTEFLSTREIKGFLENITNNFSENSIEPYSPGWNILDGVNEKYLGLEKYFNLFHNILLQKGIKYIFIDEYQDTKDCYLSIFNKIIEKGKIKFICVGDKNQQINYDKGKDTYFIGLENDRILETTYRFGNNILEKVNKIIPSGIRQPDKGIIEGNIYDNLGYIPQTGNEKQRLVNLLNFIIEYISRNNKLFIGKNNVILFQSSTDYGLGDEINKTLKQLLIKNSDVIFTYTEKPIYNIHLKLFFEKVILFVNWEIIYTEIEKELKFFYLKGDNNYQKIFGRIMNLKTIDNISDIGNILQEDGFKNGGNYKGYFKKIIDYLKDNKFNFNEANGKTLIEILNFNKDNKIYITTSTITSSKGKEYDNVFILNTYNVYGKGIQSFSNELIDNKEAKRHYYVAVSRAKENVFSFVTY